MAHEKKNTAIYTAFDDLEPYDPAQPERELLRAVLQGAMSDLRKSGAAGRRAMEYFLNPEDEYLFSFISVCNFLDLDPNTILVVTGLKKPRAIPQGLNSRSVYEN